MESLSIWSLAGVVLFYQNSAVIMAIRLSTQRVWQDAFNYDVTVSNGVNLCHPVYNTCTAIINDVTGIPSVIISFQSVTDIHTMQLCNGNPHSYNCIPKHERD